MAAVIAATVAVILIAVGAGPVAVGVLLFRLVERLLAER